MWTAHAQCGGVVAGQSGAAVRRATAAALVVDALRLLRQSMLAVLSTISLSFSLIDPFPQAGVVSQVHRDNSRTIVHCGLSAVRAVAEGEDSRGLGSTGWGPVP